MMSPCDKSNGNNAKVAAAQGQQALLVMGKAAVVGKEMTKLPWPQELEIGDKLLQ